MASDRIETAKADTKKVVADIGNKVAHAKADAEKAMAGIGKKMNDALK
jgi:hypothetical protein